MLRRKLAESLTVRIFLHYPPASCWGPGALTFALIAWATPITYTAVVSDDLQAQVDRPRRSSWRRPIWRTAGPLLDDFIRASGAEAMLVGPDGADGGHRLPVGRPAGI